MAAIDSSTPNVDGLETKNKRHLEEFSSPYLSGKPVYPIVVQYKSTACVSSWGYGDVRHVLGTWPAGASVFVDSL